jgi:endonuclease-3
MDRRARLALILQEKYWENDEALSSLDGLTDPFQILVTIVLGLGVRDSQVIKVRDELFKRNLLDRNVFTGPFRHTEPELYSEILRVLKPLGLSTKRLEAITSICEKFRDGNPTTFGDLMQIKGVGPKSAALYLYVAFGTPSVTIDTHCRRVLNRIGYPGDPKSLQIDLMTDLPKNVWPSINPKLIGFGRAICRPNPRCKECPLDCEPAWKPSWLSS